MYNKWVFSILILVVFFGCKKKQVQPNISPLNQGCDCAKEVSADFQILEVAGFNDNWGDEIETEADTIFYDKNVYFLANEENASFTWIIGSETLTGKKVGRYFDETTKGKTISVTLIVKKAPNLICFPNDDGIDTLTKTFVVSTLSDVIDVSTTVPYLIEGTYRVKDSLDIDSVDIIVDYYKNPGPDEGIRVINYDGKNSLRTAWSFYSNYRSVRLMDDAIHGTIEYKLNGQADFNLLIRSDNLPERRYHFKGRKL